MGEFDDPIEQNEKQAAYEATLAEWYGVQNRVAPGAGEQISNAARQYPSASPDMFAALSVTGWAVDQPHISEVLEHDSKEEGFFGKYLGGVSRTTLGLAWDVFDSGIPRWTRTALNLPSSNFNPIEAHQRAGRSLVGGVASELNQGHIPSNAEVFGSSGLLPGSNPDPALRPGGSAVLQGYLDQGYEPDEALGYTREWQTALGTETMFDHSRKLAESTMLHSTMEDGTVNSYHATVGRAIWQPFFQHIDPDSAPYKFVTGSTDLFLQTGGDPFNPAFRIVGQANRARRTAVASERFQTTAQHHDNIARAQFGGAKIDESTPFGLHGTDVTELEGGVLNRGGIGSSFDESFGLTGKDGSLHTFNIDDLPPNVQAAYLKGKRVEQIFSERAAAEAFPNMTPDELLLSRIEWDEANRVIDTDMLYDALGGKQGSGDLADEVDRLFDGAAGPSAEGAMVIEGDTLGSVSDVRRIIEGWDNSDEVLEAFDAHLAARKVQDESIFRAGADLTEEQAAIVARMSLLKGADEFVFSAADDLPITPMASFTPSEAQQMSDWGYVFGTRKGFEGYAMFLDDIAEAGAVNVRGQWNIHPATFENWLKTGKGGLTGSKGGRMIDYIAENGYSRIRRKLPGMSEENLYKLDKTTDRRVIENILEEWYGSPQSRYNVPKRSRTSSGLSAFQHGTPSANGRSVANVWPRYETLSAWGRRLKSEMGHQTIDPYNMDVTYPTVMSWAGLFGRNADEADSALRLMDMGDIRIDPRTKLNMTPRVRALELQDRLFEWMKKDLVRKGHTEEYVDTVIREWKEATLKNHQYAENAAGQPLALRATPGRRIKSERFDEPLDLIGSEPLADSQLGHRTLFMPSTRDARRVSAGVRWFTEKSRAARGRSWTGIGTSAPQAGVDRALSLWRNFALARIGWILRVLPDEIARMWAYGYSDLATNPVASLGYAMKTKGDVLANGDSLRALTDVAGLGADNGLLRGADDLPYLETSARSASWTQQPARIGNTQTLTSRGARGVARRYLHLYQSEMADVLADHSTIEDALRYLSDNVDDNGVLARIAARVDKDAPNLGGLSGDEAQLRRVLEALDAQRHQYTGGRWVGRDGNGQWVDMYGELVETYHTKADGTAWTRQELHDLLAPDAIGARPKGSLDELRSQLLQRDGNPPDLLSRSESYIVTKRGNPDGLDLIRHGKTQQAPNINRARVSAARNWFHAQDGTSVTRSDYIFVVGPAKKFDPGSASFAYRDLDTAASKMKKGEAVYVIQKESIPPSVFVDGNGSGRKIRLPGRKPMAKRRVDGRLSKTELDGDANKIVQQGETDLIKDDMLKTDFNDLEAYLTDSFSPEYPAVDRVSVPDRPYLNANDEKSMIDAIFRVLGRNPSLNVTRRPFVTLRNWELTAGHYVSASPAMRKKLMDAAFDAGIGDRFVGFVDDALEIRGMKAPRVGAAADMTLDEIVEMSWMEAVDDTKELFYDLTKGGAWQDGTRLVFPFADAWWEVLSRWTKLMNPAQSGAAPFKVARRGGQLAIAGESSGYFTTNQEGERVFEIPGAGSLFNVIKDSPVSFSPQISVDQLTFVDFGSPEQAFKPGFSPQVQLFASAVRNVMFDKGWLPQEGKDAYDTFFFGDFGPSDVSDLTAVATTFMPTWIRRSISRIFNGEFDDRYGAMTVRIMNGYAALAEGNPAIDKELGQEIARLAQDQASWMASVDIFASFITPAQPRNVEQMVLYNEDGDPHVKSIVALAADYRVLRDTYGADAAIDIFRKMYGFDPLRLAPATWSGAARPVTGPAWEALRDNKELEEVASFTMMAWLPDDDGEFDIDAWRASGREQMTTENVVNYYSYAAGAHRLGSLVEQRDAIYQDLEERYGGTDTAGYRIMRDQVIKPWYNREKANIATQYFAYDPGEGLPGVTNRPSYRLVWNELSLIGDPSSHANAVARKSNPELVGFVEFATAQWQVMEQYALSQGFGHEWWQTSTSTENRAPQLREGFVNALNGYVAGMSDEGQNRAHYVGQFMLSPLLEGFDWDNPVIIAPTTPSEDLLGYADTVNGR